jgi:hypothetical protein
MIRHRFVVCVDNSEYEASLELRKLYERLEDEEAEGLGQWRIVDESGEDYLYPSAMFEAIEVSPPLEEKLLRAA